MPRIYSHGVELNNFIKLNEYSSYILGLIWSDGYLYKRIDKSIYKIVVELIYSDAQNLQYIFNKTGKWTIAFREKKKRQNTLSFITHNKELFKFLENYNYMNKSGGNPSILQIIPNDLKHYWFRGLIDGDGCFYFNKFRGLRQFNICSTYDQDWIYLQNMLNQININDYQIQRKKNNKSSSSVIRFSGKKKIKLLGNYIYQGKLFGLGRKYNKFKEIIQ